MFKIYPNEVLDKITETANLYELAQHFDEQGMQVTSEMVKILCPFHEERTPSCCLYLNANKGFCYGCSYGFNCFNYVMKKLDISFPESVNFLLKFTGLDPDSIEALPKKRVEDYEKDFAAIKRVKPEKKTFEGFDDSSVESMIKLRGNHFKDRNLTQETLDFFQVGFDVKENRVTVPLRDTEGGLSGLTGRTIYKDFKEREIPKWRHYKGSDLSNNFFNINNAIKASKDRKGCIIICEGPNDVMFMHQIGFKNTIGCLRNFITESQKWLLVKNFMSVYIFLDGDLGGENGKSNIFNEINGYLDVYEMKPIQGKDPDEMSKEEIELAFTTAKKL